MQAEGRIGRARPAGPNRKKGPGGAWWQAAVVSVAADDLLRARAIIGKKEDDRVVKHTHFFQLVHDAANFGVHAMDHGCVQRHLDGLELSLLLGQLPPGNGMGGFTQDGREYVITLETGQMTPAPWVNILANPSFGTLISESGSANTWSENAHEFRLTPWSNDPVSDANSEAYYVRDEESGHFWSPTLLPAGGAAPYVTRHGFGYSAFEHCEQGIESDLCVFVAKDAPVKFAILTLRNRSGRTRRLSVTSYLEWVLGDERVKTRMHVATELDFDCGALFSRNPYNTDFAGRTAFFDVDDMADCSYCTDRNAFLGRNGTLRNPAAMSHLRMSGAVGAALDPCAAVRVPCDLADGEVREIVFRVGAERDVDAARDLVRRSRGIGAAHKALADVKEYWLHTLGAVQVTTPDRSLDILLNGWLVYQVLACRLWARNAFYQSSGAFGFRDQLQDVMALVHIAPELVRDGVNGLSFDPLDVEEMARHMARFSAQF